ncbi:MAG: alpha/beta hydrolase domain-containing protein, partial [Actinomycetota bacterium]
FCGLFGTTTPFTAEQLAALYPTKDVFIERWTQATEDAVASGAILEADAAEILASAEGYPG